MALVESDLPILITLIAAFLGALITSFSYYLTLVREYGATLQSCNEVVEQIKSCFDAGIRLSYEDVKRIAGLDCEDINRDVKLISRQYILVVLVALLFMIIGVISGDYITAVLFVVLSIGFVIMIIHDAYSNLLYAKNKLGEAGGLLKIHFTECAGQQRQ